MSTSRSRSCSSCSFFAYPTIKSQNHPVSPKNPAKAVAFSGVFQLTIAINVLRSGCTPFGPTEVMVKIISVIKNSHLLAKIDRFFSWILVKILVSLSIISSKVSAAAPHHLQIVPWFPPPGGHTYSWLSCRQMLRAPLSVRRACVCTKNIPCLLRKRLCTVLTQGQWAQRKSLLRNRSQIPIDAHSNIVVLPLCPLAA